jgi:branched-chain amino acid transport system substrate-binding protein
MKVLRIPLSAAALACAVGLACFATDAAAQVSDDVVKIGVLTDMTGFLSDVAGPGSVTAVRMAVADFGGQVLGKPIEVLAADNANKPDVAANLARTWFDNDKVDVITDLGNSATGLSSVQVAAQKNKIAIAVAPGTTRITNEECTPTGVHYAYDTFALAKGTASTLVKTGLDSWYFVTIDFAGGHSIEKDAVETVRANGGKVLGTVRHPIDANDFSSYILQAQASKAKVVGFATAGQAAVNAIKTAHEFGLREGGQTLAGLYFFVTDIHSLGLKVAQDMIVTTAFYWDMNDETRAWSKRFLEQTQRMPTQLQAANYSAIMHYLKAVQAAGTDDTAAVMKRMREMRINDFFAKNGKIREDGRMVHDMYVVRVKKPDESKYPWDYYEIKATVPAEEAFQPLAKSTCPLVRK